MLVVPLVVLPVVPLPAGVSPGVLVPAPAGVSAGVVVSNGVSVGVVVSKGVTAGVVVSAGEVVSVGVSCPWQAASVVIKPSSTRTKTFDFTVNILTTSVFKFSAALLSLQKCWFHFTAIGKDFLAYSLPMKLHIAIPLWKLP